MYRSIVLFGSSPTADSFKVGTNMKSLAHGNLIFALILRGEEKHPMACAGLVVDVTEKTFKFGLETYKKKEKPGKMLFAYTPDALIKEARKVCKKVDEDELRRSCTKSFYSEPKQTRAIRKKSRARKKER